MKIGILTFSAAYNFGAQLQCYALFKTVQRLGFEVEVIDYRPSYLQSYEPKFGFRDVINKQIPSLIRRWKQYRYWRTIYDGYVRFRENNQKMSPCAYDIQSLMPILNQYDKVIIGSDQIWNPQFNGDDDIWYGQSGQGSKYMTYAASSGDVNIWIEKTQNLQQKLQNFKHISVREREMSQVIKVMTGVEPPVVLDPSILVNPEVWSEWINPVIKEKYIVIYQGRPCDEIFRLAENISTQLGCSKIIPLDLFENVEKLGYKTRITKPSEFISLIYNASAVLTTSFHGTAFSTVLNTPFYYLKLNDGGDGRAENLLNSIGLSDRIIEIGESVKFTKIDFSGPNSKIEELRRQSVEYLTKSIKS